MKRTDNNAPSWKSQDFLNAFIPLKDNAAQSHVYSMMKGLRVAEYSNTVEIVRQGYYVTEDGHRVDLGDGAEMMRGTRLYDKEIHTGTHESYPDAAIEVVNDDCLAVAVRLKAEGYKPAVLNMANRQNPGGGVTHGSGAQEETLFRRTNLFQSLYQFARYADIYGVKPSADGHYPLDRNFGGIYTPGAQLFREDESKGYRLMDEPVQLSFITVAGMNRPHLTADGQQIAPHLVDAVKNKMRTILRIGLVNGHDALVLGALGCGAFRNPPRHVARLFHEVLNEDEFRLKFRLIAFAVLDDHNAHLTHNPEGNLRPFAEEFNGMGRKVEGKTVVHNVIILDRSGSMHRIRQAAIDGFNETLMGIQKAQEKYAETQQHFVTLVAFCSCHIQRIYDKTPAAEARPLTLNDYVPCCGTPLYDAMGMTLSSIEHYVKDLADATVVVTVITDGEENASREYTQPAIAKLVGRLREEGWAFNYMGANQDAFEVAQQLAINNARNFDYTPDGATTAMRKDRKSRERYYAMLNEQRMESPCMPIEARRKAYSKMADEAFEEENENE